MAEFAKWWLVGAFVMACVLTITSIGKPRKPLTSGTAAVAVVFNAAYAIAIVLWWQT